MKIAAFCRNVNDDNCEFLRHALSFVRGRGHQLFLYKSMLTLFEENSVSIFSSNEQLKAVAPIDFIISFGGDGSFIDTANLVADLGIPLVGVNTGRIGFLTSITSKNFEEYWLQLEEGNYTIEERALLHVDADSPLPLRNFFALNDVSIHASEVNAIAGVKLWINEELVNTYWADGLIVATPTGSTAYSLSCGGPILHPKTNVNVVTPIATHSLSVRPIIVNNDDVIKIRVDSRSKTCLLTVDSARVTLQNPVELIITKENFSMKTIRFFKSDFYSVIREKLLWGVDVRNFDVD